MRIVCIGELLWDELPSGRRPGGAPANVAVHAARGGADVSLISRVGDDEDGRELVEQLRRRGVDVSAVATDPDLPTGRVVVTRDTTGEPGYTILAPTAWDALEATPEAVRAVASADAVCFGTLSQRQARGMDTVRSLVAAAAGRAIVLCDLNLRPPFVSGEVIVASIRMASTVKLNEDEMRHVASVLGLAGDVTTAASSLREAFDLEMVALTRGDRGSRLLTRRHVVDTSALRVGVVDTVGAGDAFSAGLLLGLCRGLPLRELADGAARAAADACGHAGAWPPLD